MTQEPETNSQAVYQSVMPESQAQPESQTVSQEQTKQEVVNSAGNKDNPYEVTPKNCELETDPQELVTSGGE